MSAPKPPSSPARLDRDRACVLVIDVQDRLHAAMPESVRPRVEKYTAALIATGRELGLPVLATEQYPRGLGPLLAPLRESLASPPLEKLSFSCAGDAAFVETLARTGRRQVIVAGEEAHVCVYQTARDLVAAGYDVHVCADAVASRSEEHRQIGLSLCREAGARITTAETAIFDLLGQAGTPEFKKLSALIR